MTKEIQMRNALIEAYTKIVDISNDWETTQHDIDTEISYANEYPGYYTIEALQDAINEVYKEFTRKAIDK